MTSATGRVLSCSSALGAVWRTIAPKIAKSGPGRITRRSARFGPVPTPRRDPSPQGVVSTARRACRRTARWCSRCKICTYCSKDCQKKDWKAHKEQCNNHLKGEQWTNEHKHTGRKMLLDEWLRQCPPIRCFNGRFARR